MTDSFFAVEWAEILSPEKVSLGDVSWRRVDISQHREVAVNPEKKFQKTNFLQLIKSAYALLKEHLDASSRVGFTVMENVTKLPLAAHGPRKTKSLFCHCPQRD